MDLKKYFIKELKSQSNQPGVILVSLLFIFMSIFVLVILVQHKFYILHNNLYLY